MADEELQGKDQHRGNCDPIYLKPQSVGDIKVGGYSMCKGFPCKIRDYSTAKTGKHGSAKAMYCGIDIFSGKRYDDGGPTSSMTWEPIVERKEYQIMDLNDRDVNEKGAIVSICDEAGETVDDLRVPIEGEEKAEYLPLVEAIQANMAGSGKDVYVTVLEGCGQRKILSQFLLK